MEPRLDRAERNALGGGNLGQGNPLDVMHDHHPTGVVGQLLQQGFQLSGALVRRQAILDGGGLGWGLGEVGVLAPPLSPSMAVDEVAVGDSHEPRPERGGPVRIEAMEVTEHFLPDLLERVLGVGIEASTQAEHDRPFFTDQVGAGPLVGREGQGSQVGRVRFHGRLHVGPRDRFPFGAKFHLTRRGNTP